ncbi:MAG: hypothetical protein LZ170_00090 [Thaumarchaeota archaeon]|jgi:uncharacterized membrane protein|nr:hypothetical protein [Candidatus Terraquivivens yellowstonensis]MCL7398624.1 hypothetical protein [Candidatus Terraquivivens yellowstonensis]
MKILMNSAIGSEERIWGFIAWLIPLIGGILVLVLKPDYKYAKHWAYLSISFFVVAVIASIVAYILSFIPFLGLALSALFGLILLVVWIIGILKSLNNVYWSPPVIYDLAKRLGL